ncbi:hypothetical protein CB0940_11064 [Cercospora beticola]|uniref:Uncharacterized protein n=1 Tax=Cercospora beticola TaxID=122368 RepID=A0A2G5HDR4_CERBT|nr:hypothetical protein CB0940_11064 [Cercospora beticola]PIA90668.1 hypothetical protein CB0940_11064 [Cercospora beticola]WPB07894.1 hypothetical protein RHO25_012558 [Cercospora beticola]
MLTTSFYACALLAGQYAAAVYIPSSALAPETIPVTQTVASITRTAILSTHDINDLPTPTPTFQTLIKKRSCNKGGLLIACPEDAPVLPHYTLNPKPDPKGKDGLLAFGRIGQDLFKNLTYKPPVFEGTKTMGPAAKRTLAAA